MESSGSKYLITLYERLKPLKGFIKGSASPVVMRKLGPPLLAGQPAFCGEDFPSIVFSFTHDALSDIDFIRKTTNQTTPLPIRQIDLCNITRKSYPFSHKGHSLRFSSPLHCSHHPPRADVYRWQSDVSHSWTLWCWGIFSCQRFVHWNLQ